MVVEDTNTVQEIKDYLLKSPSHFGGAKFTRMMREFSDDQIVELFDEKVLSKLEKVSDYDSMSSVFRAVPGLVQEKMWESVYIQKILLGIGLISDDSLKDVIIRNKFFSTHDLPKRAKQGKFYYNPVKLRALEVLFRYIKSDEIIEELHFNKYFHMIILCSKKIPESFYKYINAEKLFCEIVSSDIYKMVDVSNRNTWVQNINFNCSKILLPYDVKSLFSPSKSFSTWYYGREYNTVASMLHSKLYALLKKNMKLDITKDSLKKLNLQELNVLKSDKSKIVDQEIVNSLLCEIIEDSFSDGTIYNNEYLSTEDLDIPVKRALFKLTVDKAIGNPQYEEQILEHLYSILFTTEFNELEKRAVITSLKNALVNTDEENVGNLFDRPNDLKSMFFLRFNITASNMAYLYGISVEQLMKINVRHINKLVQLLYDSEQDELSDLYSKAIKMYFVFGLERATELLSGKYPVDKMFLDNVSKLDVSKVVMKAEGKKYLPVSHEEFNRFLFATNNINYLFDDETAIYSCWYYLYNNFESIKDVCKGHITLVQAETILKEQVNNVKYELEPDCYRLEKVLYEAGLGNKSHCPNEDIYDEMCNIHKKQIKRVQSTIPYVKGTLDNGWSYEVMRYDSAIAYVLGYRAGCCIRVNDIAHNHLLHALLCENGRILLTYKPDGTIASFSPLKRNGELLIANSIEAIEKENQFITPMVSTFEAGIKEICRVSKETERDGYLKVAVIGNASNRKPEGIHWPINIKTPTILEKKDPLYNGTDCYHRTLHVFYKDNNIDLVKLKYGEVKQKYYDPRNKIFACSYDRNDVLLLGKILKIIDSIRYTKWLDEGNSKAYFDKTKIGYFDAIFCNDDWYVIVDFHGVYYDCLGDDPRAKKEMEATLEVINQYIENKDDIKNLVLQYKEYKAH